jgi:hypothetical protein
MNLDMMISLTEGIQTKADKMRVLERSGFARADIARFLGVRYQQVRNTLEGDKRTGYNPEIVATGAEEPAGQSFHLPRLREIKVGEDGFGQIPPDLIEGLDDSDEPKLFALRVKGGLFICTGEGLVERAVQTL